MEENSAGFMKMNVNTNIDKENANMGSDNIIKHERGRLIAARGSHWRGFYSPREAWAAIREALSWIKEKNFARVRVETDLLLVVQHLNHRRGESPFYLVIRDIEYLLRRLSQVSLSFVKRLANRATHAITKQFVSRSDCVQ